MPSIFVRDDSLSSLFIFCIMHVPLKELTVCLYGRAYQRMFMKYYLEQGIPGLFAVKEKYLSSDFYVICRLYQELALISYCFISWVF